MTITFEKVQPLIDQPLDLAQYQHLPIYILPGQVHLDRTLRQSEAQFEPYCPHSTPTLSFNMAQSRSVLSRIKRSCHESIQRLHHPHSQRRTIDLTDPHVLHEELLIALQLEKSPDDDDDAEELAAYLLDEKLQKITGYPSNFRPRGAPKPRRPFLGLKWTLHFRRHRF